MNERTGHQAWRAELKAQMCRSSLCIAFAALATIFLGANLAVVHAAPQSPPPPQYISAPNITLGFQPSQVSLADVNGDGKLDIIVVANNAIMVYLGNGDGTFQPPITTSVSSSIGQFAIADVNGDGRADLIGEGYSGVSIYFGNGDGTFNNVSPPTYQLGYSGTLVPLYIADINGDGYPDIIAPQTYMSGVSILLNNHDGVPGAFSNAQTVSLPSGSGYEVVKLAVGDFNGDQKPDLAIGVTKFGSSLANAVIVMFNNTSNGAARADFTTLTPVTVPLTTVSGNSVADQMNGFGIGDFGNGHLDLFATEPSYSGSGYLYFVEGNGDGTFNTAQPISAAVPTSGGLMVEDFNNDGNADVAFTDGNDGFTVMLNQGLSPAGVLALGTPRNYVAGAYPLAPVGGNGTSFPLASDLSGDGFNDLVVPMNSGVSIFLNNGDGTFQAAQSTTVGASPQSIVAFQNFAGHGENDVAAMNSGDGTVTVLGPPTPGAGALYTLSTIAAPSGAGTPTAITAGCLRTSVPASQCQSFVATAYYNSSTGASEVVTSATTSFALPNGDSALAMAIGDFNGDGNNDLALALSNGTVEVFTGDGSGTFSNPQTINIGFALAGISVADFDSDGRPDLAVLIQSPPNVGILINNTTTGNATVTFQNISSYAITSAYSGVTPVPTAMTVADFDGTNGPDIAVADGSEELDVFLNNGHGSFTILPPQPVFGLTGAIAAGDFNGDGITDIAAVNSVSSGDSCNIEDAAIILLGNGDGTFQPANTPCGSQNAGFLYSAGNAPSSVAAADFNGDGTPDLVVADQGGNAITLILSGTPSTRPPVLTVSGVSPNSGPAAGGTSVTITGTDFTGVTAVMFGSAAATSFTVVSTTQITATSPAAGAAGAVDVKVTTSAGTSATSAADEFTYVATPTVTGVSPSSGPITGGTPVTITGTNFTNATAVYFALVPVSAFSINSSGTQITVNSPGGSVGAVDVFVFTPGGLSPASSADQFTYVSVPGPTVTGVSPNSGPVSGGTPVTITGTNFAGATAVYFALVPVSAFSVNSSGTQITVSSPAGSVGAVDVFVFTPGGLSPASSADQFTYYVPLLITTLTLPNGIVGTSYSQTIAASEPATFAVTSGSLPTGLALASDGTLSGTPSEGGSFTFTITAAGTIGGSAGQTYTVEITSSVSDNEPITVSDSDVVNAFTLAAPISVAAPVADFSAGALGFSSQSQSQQTIAISNIGEAPASLALASIAISPASAPFTASSISCFNGAISSGATSATLPSAGFCTVTITYTGSAPTTDTGTLVFTDNAALSNLTSGASGSNYTQSITLTGSGASTAPPGPPLATIPITDNETITVSDAETFPETVDSEAITVTDTVNVTAVTPVIKIGTPATNPYTIVAGTGYTVTVTLVNGGNVPLDALNLIKATLGGLGALTFPAGTTINNLAPGASVTLSATFTSSAGAAGKAVPLSFTGTYAAGSLSGNWTISFRSVTLP
ncbi:MAG: FG-GAP-like repeat-containing protein [Candidatus Acidiferrales bacterium]